MAKFWFGFSAFSTTTSAKTAMSVHAIATSKVEVVEISMYGAGATAPADVQHRCECGFHLINTQAGVAGASPTPEPCEVGSTPASPVTANTAYTTEPSAYNTNVIPLFSFNQRGGMRWGVTKGEGFATNNTGATPHFGTRVISSVAGAVDGNKFFWS